MRSVLIVLLGALLCIASLAAQSNQTDTPANISTIHRPQMPVRIDVIPGWPNPHSQKVYILQVGSFPSPEAAAGSEYWVRVAGFDVAHEIHDSMYRVLVMNVPAASVFPAVQRLAAFGFRQFWVREQR